MRRYIRGMGLVDIVLWVIECAPWAALISIVLTLSASILFDISLESESWLGLFARFLPGFIVGLLIMLALSSFLLAALRAGLRIFGLGRD